jgi:hypothetical protein
MDLAREIKLVLATAVIRAQSGISCDYMDEYAIGIAVEDIPKRGRIHEQLPIVLVGHEIELHPLCRIAFVNRASAACHVLAL